MQKYQLNINLEDLRRSGKPFYWVAHEKLQKLKRFCEGQKDENMRKQALEALYEY